MKLYTEEQVREAFNCGRLYLGREGDTNFYHLIEKLTPIELPSDEEIEKISQDINGVDLVNICGILEAKAFNRGAKWMRDKIQGGNK